MATQGRKNVRGKAGVRFKAPYTKSKHENMLRNVVTDLIIHGAIKVTAAVSKDVIKEADRLVTLAKSEDVMNAKRQAARFVRNIVADKKTNATALDKLFADIGPKMKDRNGGYTRQFKLGNRRGDNAPIVLVTWVD
ncbi:MAG: 50S ribosomal protein L17 [Erysipelotrichia bacterium]|nr:50S ribosomal protein L17 [Erysipelotrichia bacterium]